MSCSTPVRRHVTTIGPALVWAALVCVARADAPDRLVFDGGTWFYDLTPSLVELGDGVAEGSSAFGAAGMTALAGDIDGDGIADRVVTHVLPGCCLVWHLDLSAGGVFGDGATDESETFGPEDAVPLLGDVNGDGLADRVVYVATPGGGIWYADLSVAGAFGDQVVDMEAGTSVFGAASDSVVALGDFNADGLADRVIHRADDEGHGLFLIDYTTTQPAWGDGVVDLELRFGAASDRPLRLLADLNRDRRADLIVTRAGATATEWSVDYSPWDGVEDAAMTFGGPGLQPVVAPLASAAPALATSIDNGYLAVGEGAGDLTINGGVPALDVVIDDAWFGAAPPPITVTSISGGWRVTREKAGGRLEETVTAWYDIGPNAWRRHGTYTNTSSATQDLTFATYRLGIDAAGLAAEWDPDFLWFGAPTGGRSVGVAHRSAGDHYYIFRSGGVVYVDVHAAWRLGPGEQADLGETAVWVEPGGAVAMRPMAQQWFAAAGIVNPFDAPAWLDGAILYEAAAGGHVNARFGDVAGFDNLAGQAGYLADLGCNVLWLNSPFEHKTPPDAWSGGWNHYDPRSFTRIDAVLGGAEALGRLADRMGAAGLLVLGELVPWGGHSEEAQALPDWWIRDRRGEYRRPWGGHTVMGYSSPEWQSVMHDALELLATDFGMEGARIDVAGGHGANWSSPRTNHASFSTLGGSLEMLAAMCDGGTTGVQRAVLLAEDVDNRPEYMGLGPVVGYGYRAKNRLRDLLHNRALTAEEMAAELTGIFERERGALPTGGRTLRQLVTHDDVVNDGRILYRTDAGLALALYGVCASLRGIPMIYQEEESGLYAELRRINWARRAIPELGPGEERFGDVAFDAAAFSVVRSHGGRHALALVNLSSRTLTGTVTLPGWVNVGPDGLAHDAVSGRTASISGGAFGWTLDPWATALIRLGRPPRFMVPDETWGGQPDSMVASSGSLEFASTGEAVGYAGGGLAGWIDGGLGDWAPVAVTAPREVWTSEGGTITLTPLAEGYRVEVEMDAHLWRRPPELFVANADRWLVAGRTALLEDRVLRRHYPFAPDANYRWDRTMYWGPAMRGRLYDQLAPTGRLWQSIFEPLHPEGGAVAFEHADGGGLIVDQFEGAPGNLVLTDRSDEATVEPYGLALRFYANDPEVMPDVRAYGVDQRWRFLDRPAPDLAPVTMSFRVRLTQDSPRDELAAAAPPMGPAPDVATESVDVDVIPGFSDEVYMPSPGTYRWGNLRAEPGWYRIGPELVHSRVGPTGSDRQGDYVVELDGTPQPLEWTDLATYVDNDYWFGIARTPPVWLDGTARELTVRTTDGWAGLRRYLYLIALGDTPWAEAFAADGPRHTWSIDPWSIESDAGAPEGDGSIWRSGVNTYQLAVSELFGRAAAAYPMTIRAVVRLDAPAGLWATTRIGLRLDNTDAMWVDLPRHAPDLVQLYEMSGSSPVMLGGDVSIADLGAGPGDWLRVGLIVHADSLQATVERRQGGTWGNPVVSTRRAATAVSRVEPWRVMLEALSSEPDQHAIDHVEVFEGCIGLEAVGDVVVFDDTSAKWHHDLTPGSFGVPDAWSEGWAYFGATGHTPRMADFDGDGIDDRAVILGGGTWVIDVSDGAAADQGWTSDVFGDGAGTVSGAYGPSPGPHAIPLADDVDGDGHADRIVVESGVWRVDFAAGDLIGDGVDDTMAGAASFGITAGERVALGDFNDDGLADRVVWDASAGQFLVDYAPGPAAWGDGVPDIRIDVAGVGDAILAPSQCDFDGDGRAELMVYGSDGTHTIARIRYSPHYTQERGQAWPWPAGVLLGAQLGGDSGAAPFRHQNAARGGWALMD